MPLVSAREFSCREKAVPKVEIVQMGPLPPALNLRRVARTANKVQEHFQLVVGDPINHLGQPNHDGEYKVADLALLLEMRRHQNSAEFEIGVTDSPLFWGLFSGVDSASNNIVISVAPVAALLSNVNKTLAAYVLVEIAAQLLTADYRRQTNLSVEPEICALPWHEETRSCVFDYCGNPPHTLKKLMSPSLCPLCKATLESANIRGSVIRACRNIVKKAVYAEFRNVLAGVLSDPINRAVFGGLFFYLLVEFLTYVGLNRLEIGVLVLALLLVVVLKHYWKSRRDLL